MPFEEDLDVFFDDFGVDVVTAEGVVFRATLDATGSKASIVGVQVSSGEYSIEYSAAVVALSKGATVTIGNDTYKVRATPELLDDGLIARATLQKQA